MPSGGRNTYALGIALAIAAGVVFSSGTATAGCGDHVRVLAKDSLSPSANGATSGQTQAGDYDQGRPFHSCHGPKCSAGRSIPVVPLGALSASSADTKSSTVRGVETVDDGAGLDWNRPFDVLLREIRRTNPVFHPPRRS
jgi:hypothetical protein